MSAAEDHSSGNGSDAAVLLQQSPFPALRRLQVTETPSSVALSGTVASAGLKQLAVQIIAPALRGRQLVNQIDVNPDEPQLSDGNPASPEEMRLTPELRQWAQQQVTDEEILAGLREIREKGGLELRDFLDELERAASQ
jgi:hypothetical protein